MQISCILVCGILGAIVGGCTARDKSAAALGFLAGAWAGYALTNHYPFPTTPVG